MDGGTDDRYRAQITTTAPSEKRIPAPLLVPSVPEPAIWNFTYQRNTALYSTVTGLPPALSNATF